MENKITESQLVDVVSELFLVDETLSAASDLSKYVKDSIDLGELIAVIKERHGVVPRDTRLFKTNSKLGDVLKIFNHEVQ
jgi:acyl carrier protein